MRILFLHSADAWSGRARVFIDVARALARRDVSVAVAGPPTSEFARRAVAAGLELLPIVAHGTPRRAWELQRHMRTWLADVVFVHTEREQVVASLAALLARRGAIVRRMAAGEPFDPGRGGRLSHRVATIGYLFTGDGPGPAAPQLRETPPMWTTDLGVDVATVDGARLTSRSETGRLLVCVYAREGRRRLPNVLRTMALLAARHPELSLAVVGVPDDVGEHQLHATALGIGPRVHWLGEPRDRREILRRADVAWVVADEDDAALGCLDVMAMGVPLIAERTTLTERYVANGISGILMPRLDPPATAAAAAVLLADEPRRLALGGAARARVARDFTERAMAEGFARAANAAHAVRSVNARSGGGP